MVRPGRCGRALRALALTAAVATAAAGCTEGSPTVPADPVASAVASAVSAPLPGVTLPPDPLLPLVPTPAEVPRGMVPVLTGSGPRDAAAIAEYSGDPAAARTSLTAHGFRSAYVAQYADPANARVLSVVVVRFADGAGATADLAGDLTATSGDVVEAAPVGQQSQLRRQALPGAGGGELLTLRFRTGTTTWLLAYGDRPTAAPAVAVGLGQRLVAREDQA